MSHHAYINCEVCDEEYEVQFDVDPGDPSVGIRGPSIEGAEVRDGLPCGHPVPDEDTLIEKLEDRNEPFDSIEAARDEYYDQKYHSMKDDSLL